MTNRIKMTLAAAAVAVAFATSAHAVPGIKFSADGVGAGVTVKEFNWFQDQYAIIGGMSVSDTVTASDGVDTQNSIAYFYGQGRLNTGNTANPGGVQTVGDPESRNISFQFMVPVSVTWTTVVVGGSIISQSASITDPGSMSFGADNYFRIFYNTDGTEVNQTAGTGYGTSEGEVNASQSVIFEGKITLGATSLTVTSQSTKPIGDTGTLTDQNGNTIVAVMASGAATLEIEHCSASAEDTANAKCVGGATTLDTNFFRSNLEQLGFDVNLTNSMLTQFSTGIEVPARVVNQLPNFGGLVAPTTVNNNASCDGGAVSGGLDQNGDVFNGCDAIMQGSGAKSSFTGSFAPEPGSLALLGLGLGALGFSARRRRIKAA